MEKWLRMDSTIQTTETKLCEALRDIIGKDKAELKDDISKVKDDISQVKSELKDDIRTLDEKLETSFGKLSVEIKNTEVRTMERITGVIKSVYFVGVVQFLAIIASIVVILPFFLK